MCPGWIAGGASSVTWLIILFILIFVPVPMRPLSHRQTPSPDRSLHFDPSDLAREHSSPMSTSPT